MLADKERQYQKYSYGKTLRIVQKIRGKTHTITLKLLKNLKSQTNPKSKTTTSERPIPRYGIRENNQIYEDCCIYGLNEEVGTI